jgi:hypothetical protein
MALGTLKGRSQIRVGESSDGNDDEDVSHNATMRFKNDTLKSEARWPLTDIRQAVTSVRCEKEFRASTECTVSNHHPTSAKLSAMHRRLEDTIRELCAKVGLTRDSVELDKLRVQIRTSVREHTQRLKHLAFNPLRPERRAV